LAVLVNGCGDDGPREGDAGLTSPPPRVAPKTITEADSGESFTLATDGRTSLRLSGEYEWTEPSVVGAGLQLTRVDYFQDPGFSEWSVVAVEPGRATISARGTSGSDKPLRFRVEFTVSP
jgi:hypothetical protein